MENRRLKVKLNIIVGLRQVEADDIFQREVSQSKSQKNGQKTIKKTQCTGVETDSVFTARRHASAVYAVVMCLSV